MYTLRAREKRDLAGLIFEQQMREMDARLLCSLIIKSCNEREAMVVKMRNGIECPEMTLREVAKSLDLSPERIRQIEAKAYRRMRRALRERGTDGDGVV